MHRNVFKHTKQLMHWDTNLASATPRFSFSWHESGTSPWPTTCTCMQPCHGTKPPSRPQWQIAHSTGLVRTIPSSSKHSWTALYDSNVTIWLPGIAIARSTLTIRITGVWHPHGLNALLQLVQAKGMCTHYTLTTSHIPLSGTPGPHSMIALLISWLPSMAIAHGTLSTCFTGATGILMG